MGKVKRQNVHSQPTSPSKVVDVQSVSLEEDETELETESIVSDNIIVKSKNARKRRKKNKSVLESFAHGSLRYSVDVVVKILSLLKWPIAIFLTIVLGRFLLYRSISRITNAIGSQARSGICSIPFAAPIVDNALPGFCDLSKTKLDFNDLINLQKETVQTVAVPVYSGALPLQLKKAELATNDLRALLQVSNFNAKNSLDSALQSFSTHARDSSRAIQRTVVRVGGMLDASLAMNEWAMGALQRIEGKASGIAGLVPFLNRYDTRVSVTDTYVAAMDEVSGYLQRLIESNQQAYESLDSLEEDLHLIHELISLEKQFQRTERDEVLSNLWSWLGGNRKLKTLFQTNLATLDDFERSRVANKEVVAATSVAFNKMMLQIEHLRERVARPGLAGDTIPVEMHIRSIQLGIESLRQSRDRQLNNESSDGDDGFSID